MNTIKLTSSNYEAITSLATAVIILLFTALSCRTQSTDKLKEAFKNPPDTSKPGFYWYFMDGNLSR
jgi:hypothetical protein